ncbi:hypothetical protein L6452_20350 [Arctium lappa]|uniref:Uncharacterized protein n=1 Tax=Arctium lappa TaxID=4217 RepID=A0ACB9BB39_ARCLA|nr:hypothetical protein L6452_20350 [Arctium lappa]
MTVVVKMMMIEHGNLQILAAKKRSAKLFLFISSYGFDFRIFVVGFPKRNRSIMLKFKNSDFLIARRSKQRLSRQNKDRAGCISGIVSIFDFRHGRITRRMLSDHTTHLTESTMGPSYPTSEVNSITDSEEMHLRIESLNGEKGETVRTRVKELMEEEMYGDQTGDLDYDGHVHNHEHTGKTSSRSFDSCEISNDRQVPPQKTPQYHDLKDLMNELLLIHQKRNEEQKPKSIERSNSLENERNNPKSDESLVHKPRNFFRRRSKSHECISLNVNDSPLPSNRTNGFHSERSISQFSFTEIKRKLKNAIGRSTRDSGCRENPVVDGSSRWSSPNRDHFFSERFSRISDEFKTEDGVSRLRKSETKPMENDEFGDTSYRISNIYIEAKKHLSEILRNGDEDTEFMEERHSRTLGKLLSFPEYSSPRGSSSMVNESQPFGVENDHREPEVLDEVLQTEGVLEIVKPPSPIEIEVIDVADLTEDDELSCSPTSSPSGSSLAINQKTEEVENIAFADDKTGKPSPVSVLEPMFSDDDISPARTISRSAEASIQPLRIRFEEAVPPPKNQETRIRNLVENDESAFEYIEAVLLASDLNWDDFEKRWLSSTQILDSSLYDELQIFSSLPTHDQLLLFDSTNETLKEVCDRSFGFFPDLPFVKPNSRPLPYEVWEKIESRIDGPYPHSLDQLIRKDLEESRMWMDLRSETREIVIDAEELIFEDLMDDTLSSLMHD